MGMLGGAGGSSTGAPGGGPLGSMGMDVSMHKIPLIGGFFQDPNETFKQQQFHQAGQAYSAYRPEAAQAHMNALRNRLAAFQGASDVLAAMSGRPGSTVGQELGRNPMGPSMMQQGASKGADRLPANSFFGQMQNGGLPGMPGGGPPGMGGGLMGMFGGGGPPGMGGMPPGMPPGIMGGGMPPGMPPGMGGGGMMGPGGLMGMFGG